MSIEFTNRSIEIILNGTEIETMQIDGPVADSAAEITLASWTAGQRPFAGHVSSFQILDLTGK
jgi:hypothetical protein